MAALGIIFIIAAGILLLVQRSYRQRASSIRAARPVKVSDLHATAAAVAAEMGSGSWRDYVRLWGNVECEAPLISEFKQMPCVYYSCSVRREYEEVVRQKNDEGKWETHTQQRSEIISNQQRSVPFQIVDDSGQITINPEGADLGGAENF